MNPCPTCRHLESDEHGERFCRRRLGRDDLAAAVDRWRRRKRGECPGWMGMPVVHQWLGPNHRQ